LIPDIRSIHTTSQTAIAATTMYLIHWAAVFGSVRLGMATIGAAIWVARLNYVKCRGRGYFEFAGWLNQRT
jgi:hypothetical protein